MHDGAHLVVRVHWNVNGPRTSESTSGIPATGCCAVHARSRCAESVLVRAFVGDAFQPANALVAPPVSARTAAVVPAAVAAPPSASARPPRARAGVVVDLRSGWWRVGSVLRFVQRGPQARLEFGAHQAMLLVSFDSVCSSRARPREVVLLTVPREHAQSGGHLGFGKIEEVAEDERGALARRQRVRARRAGRRRCRGLAAPLLGGVEACRRARPARGARRRPPPSASLTRIRRA